MKQKSIVLFNDPFFSPLTLLNKELDGEYYGDHRNERPVLLDSEEAYMTSIDIPGVNTADISVELEGDRLSITALRKNPLSKDETPLKKYQYLINLPKNTEHEHISAHYENGVLSLTIPKMDDHKNKKKIEILTGPKPKNWANFLSFKKTENEKVVC